MLIYVFSALIIALTVWIAFLIKNNLNLKLLLRNERELRKAQTNLEESFKNISNEVLLRSHHSFLNIAKETFDKILNVEKIEQNKKQNEFINLIQPIQENLTVFNNKISQIEKDRIDTYSALNNQVNNLINCQKDIQKETANLNKALSSPFMSGQWGEMQLKRVVEMAGMLAHCDFFEQQQSDSSKLKPDMIIKLPGDRNIIVDAKTSLNDYINAVNTGEDHYLEEHVKKVREHIKKLGQKNYWKQFSPTPEFVLMFLPGESFFSAAIKKDPTLIEYGVREKVIITTPVTLIAILKAISFSWQQEALARNVKQIGEAGKVVFANLEKLIELFKKFKKQIYENIEEYDKINSFIEKNMLPSANKLKTLGIEIDEEETNQALDLETDDMT